MPPVGQEDVLIFPEEIDANVVQPESLQLSVSHPLPNYSPGSCGLWPWSYPECHSGSSTNLDIESSTSSTRRFNPMAEGCRPG